MPAALIAARTGAVFYILWGALHIYAAWLSFELAAGLTDAQVVSKLQQNGWNLGFIALACIVVAAVLNWRNARLGFWINAIMVSLTDIGFLVLIWGPGVSTDLLGPILWLIALVATGIGRARAGG
jgi:hypothetical protein